MDLTHEIITAIVTYLVTPAFGALTYYINKKFEQKNTLQDAQIADLTARLAACEARHVPEAK